MSKKEYDKERERLLKFYEKIEKKYIHTQESKEMLIALQQEKNTRLVNLTKKYYEGMS